MIRPIQFSDYDKIKKLTDSVHKIHVENRPDIFTDEGLLNSEYFKDIVEKSMSFVFEVGGNIIGVIVAFNRGHNPIPILKKREVCFIEIFAVDDNYQKQGIGHALFDHLVEVCKNNKINSIELMCYPFNTKASEFYEELGFTVKSVKYERVL